MVQEVRVGAFVIRKMLPLGFKNFKALQTGTVSIYSIGSRVKNGYCTLPGVEVQIEDNRLVWR